jgi:hypothetical protein
MTICGLMVDTLLKYIQCEIPLNFPSLGSLTGGLGNLLPKGCAGNAISGALFQSANIIGNNFTSNQPILFRGGEFTPGSTQQLNQQQMNSLPASQQQIIRDTAAVPQPRPTQ